MDSAAVYFVARHLLAAARHAIDPQEQLAELPATERIILQDLVESAPTSIQDIARRTQIAQSRVSAAVQKWRERGRIDARPDPTDRRRSILTSSATLDAEVLAGMGASADTVLQALGVNLSARERRSVLQALELLHERLKQAARARESEPL
ncbi:MarR family transcriptional regulator [Phenylobacterium sp. SCN 70-31]|uniref:MarR family transcriptional regulator n=1 Tax=Phenylobacterium sp. SCN 70-31 TaxID=1660129 RepID=UPI00086DD88A|nr:MarR family transcriptional regulator [Phenylobacterium sp. SCN 70-31]ODT89910.1 MAG: hypothetical protein ABS78_00830 [Phenylobacterium sp. SCN 70-31]